MEDYNVTYKLEGTVLTLTVDLSKTLYNTGKSEIVATSKGFQPLPDDPHYAVSLNVCRKLGGKTWRVKGEVV